jgi:OOP family OmpA-OmpF porin
MVCVMFLVMIASTSYAGVTPGGISAGFNDGWYCYDPQEKVTNTTQAGIWIGYDASKHVGIEAKLGYSGSLNNAETQKVRTFVYRLDGLYYFIPDAKLVPYAAIGVGARSTRYTDDTYQVDANGNQISYYNGGDRNYFAVDLGLGLKWFITDYLIARLDVRDVMLPNKNKQKFLNNVEATLGIGFYISKKPKPVKEEPVTVVEPAPEPAPVVTPPPAPEPAPAPVAAPIVTPPPAPQVVTVVEKQIIEKGKATLDIKFDFGKATIQGSYDKDLKDFAAVMKKHPDLKIYIEGHTDNIGTAAVNKKLSQERADNVKRYLVEKLGVDGSRLTAIGYGEDKPVASNKTEEGRLKNRRVDAVVEYSEVKKESK